MPIYSNSLAARKQSKVQLQIHHILCRSGLFENCPDKRDGGNEIYMLRFVFQRLRVDVIISKAKQSPDSICKGSKPRKQIASPSSEGSR
jgi:hypothetical protein